MKSFLQVKYMLVSLIIGLFLNYKNTSLLKLFSTNKVSNLIFMKQLKVIMTEKKGRGVFANEDIAQNSIIEKCETIKFSESDAELINETVLGNYWFGWEDDHYKGIICLGYGSLYNHSKVHQNCSYFRRKDKMYFYAIKDIRKGEEILIDYGTNPHFSEE